MNKKEEIIQSFDPNGPGINGNLFGLPYTPETSEIVVIPVPWEVTVSYHTGTALGPAAILDASSQVDVYVKDIPDAWKLGVSLTNIPDNLLEESNNLRELSAQHIRRVERGEPIHAADPLIAKINEASENLNIYIKSATQRYLRDSKMVGLLGGDHSTPLGFLRALSEKYERFGILQIDAHADLRKAYEGFTYSHASIMYNALKLPSVSRLIQVGIRDFCEEEQDVINRSRGRISTFFDEDLKAWRYKGETWDALCNSIIKELPANVYISFDIDGLDPKLCPNTGTPVAGGLEFQEAIYLIKKVAQSRKIIGFDLCEVAPGQNDWDANVGARLLYNLCNWMAVSQGKLKIAF
ncbi:agmatinase family protein [Ohtaekwangia koreensis]|uniref:Agmatinase n=1 Tax=Ohtaekwangia koreensis TaxID=688867 RepID=A0A1T5M5I7_9BACT|nr:agmatinase family protein [Ohtaekwangia koreensis]SKC83129.1 agmatinase [Ohtaekwangia koreensis]